MVSPISMSSPNVYFRGEGVDLGAPGRFSSAPAETEGDKLDLSSEATAKKSKKGGVLKTIGAVIGSAAAIAVASFGLFKWKGDKWLLPEAKGFMNGIKKWLVKPGEFLNNKVYEPLASRFSGKSGKLEELVDEIEEVAEEAASK